MSKVHILDCPFCGKAPVVTKCANGSWFVRCENKKCNAELCCRTYCYDTRADAIKAWNTRASEGVLKRFDEWVKLSDAGMRLRCGEMTAQEIRTVRAVLNVIRG